MSENPRILVTGAAGRLGRPVCHLLHESGYSLLATDRFDQNDVPYAFRKANLLDHKVAKELLGEIDILIHLGNHPGMVDHIPQVLLNENMTMNQNMFQGAAETGVDRIIFSSTLQLIGSHIDKRTVINEPKPLSYPLSGDTIPDPSNVYGLSKELSERMLRYYAERCGIDSVAIRFPLIHKGQCAADDSEIFLTDDEASFSIIREAFSGISFDDASRLILSIVQADLKGFRIYMPATSHLCSNKSISELIESHYPETSPATDDLIDTSRITKETGWEMQSDYRPPHF